VASIEGKLSEQKIAHDPCPEVRRLRNVKSLGMFMIEPFKSGGEDSATRCLEGNSGTGMLCLTALLQEGPADVLEIDCRGVVNVLDGSVNPTLTTIIEMGEIKAEAHGKWRRCKAPASFATESTCFGTFDHHHLKVVFKDLAKNPDKLADMWPDLEVQYLWLALANSVFSDLKLSFYELKEQEGDSQLQCVECIPKEEDVEREHTICLLRWNQKVAAHYDLIDEVVALGSGDVTPDAADDAQVEPPDRDAVAAILEMFISKKEQVRLWKVGTLLEAEMMDPNFPNYRDTIHPVKVVKEAYQCQLLAFEGETNVDVWNADLLHEPRDYSPNESWNKDDEVHFRIRNRKVGKEMVDGDVSKDGIWVKGIVAQSENGRIVVEHIDWGGTNENERKVSHVLPTDIRWANDPCDDVVVFEAERGNTEPFSTETERARLARLPLTKEDCRSIMTKNAWVRSGVVDHMVSLFNVANARNGTVLVTNIGLEHALFPNAKEVTDLKAFLEQNDPTTMGARWHRRWSNVLEHLLMPVNIGNTHWCLLVVNLRTGKVELWDSLKTPESDWYDQIDRERLQGFMGSFSPETPDVHVSIASVPPQKGTSSCGVFMLEFIRAFLNGEREGSKVDVSATRVAEYRGRITDELKRVEETAAATRPVKKRRAKK
jgi:hypothetical protein